MNVPKYSKTGMYVCPKNEDTKEWLWELQRRYIFQSGKTQGERTVSSVVLTCFTKNASNWASLTGNTRLALLGICWKWTSFWDRQGLQSGNRNSKNFWIEVWRDCKIQPRNHIRYPRMLWYYALRVFIGKKSEEWEGFSCLKGQSTVVELIAERRTCTWLSNDEFTKFINISEIWIWIRRMQHWEIFYMDS